MPRRRAREMITASWEIGQRFPLTPRARAVGEEHEPVRFHSREQGEGKDRVAPARATFALLVVSCPRRALVQRRRRPCLGVARWSIAFSMHRTGFSQIYSQYLDFPSPPA